MADAPRSPVVSPKVSVVMAVHNGLPYLSEAIASIRNQSLTDLEIIVVDDASKDGSTSVVEALLETDKRLHLIRLTQNVGLAGALNHGLEAATGRYIARMDADDIAHPDRLARQAADLDAHPGIVLLGGSINRIDAQGTFIRREIRDLGAQQAAWITRLRAPLVHPTFLFRNGRGLRYNPALRVAQDYDFTARAAELGQVVSRPEVVLDYRVHSAAASHTRAQLQAETAYKIAARVQEYQLPADIAQALAPVNAALYQGMTDLEAVWDGLRRLMVHDCREAPAQARWIRSQTADLLHYLVCARGGQGRTQAALTLAQMAPQLALPLARHKFAQARQK